MEEVKISFRIDEYHGSYYYERKDVETSDAGEIFSVIIGRLDNIVKNNDNKIDKLNEIKFFVYEYDNKKEKTGRHRLTIHCKVKRRRFLALILRGTHSETGNEAKIATITIPEECWYAEDIISDLKDYEYANPLQVDKDIEDGCCLTAMAVKRVR